MARTANRSSKSKKSKAKNSEQIKAFKASEDVISFYRYIHENNLRYESKVLLETVLSSIKSRKKSRVLQ